MKKRYIAAAVLVLITGLLIEGSPAFYLPCVLGAVLCVL